MKLLTAATIALIASSASAHHGSNGQFDTTKEMSVSGVVTNIRFVNPHSYVYFDSINTDGSSDEWRCELRAGSLLKRNGWTTDMFATGTAITIDGSPARREEFGCLTLKITFEDGRVVSRYDTFEEGKSAAILVDTSAELAAGTPNINGNWVAPPRNPSGARPTRPEGPPPTGGNRAAGGRPAGGPPGGGNQIGQTEAGKIASAGFKTDDNPRYHCQATNIFHDWTFDQHVNKIEQTDDKIVMTFGFMDIVRTIHLDMESHPKDITPSRSGHSIGSWDGDSLVVETIAFEEGYLDGRSGVKHSDQARVVEIFTLSEDGTTLNSSYKFEDPLYLTVPREGQTSVGKTTDAYDPYECEDLTEEIVEGF